MRFSRLVRMLLLVLCLSLLIGGPAMAGAAGPSFPDKAKIITFIVPAAAGGANDVAARLLSPMLEKELGTQIQVVTKVGAGAQVGSTVIATAKPDGYTVGYTIFAPVITAYLDPDRQAVFNRTSFQTLGTHFTAAMVISVAANSPYKTLADLLAAAKAKPYSIKAGATGILGTAHLASLQIQKAAGIKFSSVQFLGGAPALTALMGGHIDVAFNGQSEVVTYAKSGTIRVLGIFDKQPIPQLPDTKTMADQGYKVYMTSTSGVSAPAGVSREVIQAYSNALKSAVTNEEHRKKLIEAGYTPTLMGPEEYASFWSEYEAEVKPLVEMGKAEAAAK
jgi:tripartite-type tricarboxylate transporter receptor subunit TctC